MFGPHKNSEGGKKFRWLYAHVLNEENRPKKKSGLVKIPWLENSKVYLQPGSKGQLKDWSIQPFSERQSGLSNWMVRCSQSLALPQVFTPVIWECFALFSIYLNPCCLLKLSSVPPTHRMITQLFLIPPCILSLPFTVSNYEWNEWFSFNLLCT